MSDYEFATLYTTIDGHSIEIWEDGDVTLDCPENAEFTISVSTLQKMVFRTHVFMKQRQDYKNGVIK